MPLPMTAAPSVTCDGVAGVEGAADVDDADRQQRRPAVAQRARRAGVDDDRAVRRLGVSQPELEARVARLLRREARARLARAGEHRARARPAAGRCRSRSGCRPRSPSRPRRPSSACRPSPAATSRGRSRGAPRASKSSTSPSSCARRVGARVGREQPVGVGQQDEQVGADQDRDLGGEEVVVAEGDLVGRRRVVLVDDRHDAPVEQAAQRLARVEVVRPRAHVEERQQHLRAT